MSARLCRSSPARPGAGAPQRRGARCRFLAMDALAEDCRTMSSTPPERARFLQEWDADAAVAQTKSQLAKAAKGKGKK